MQQTQLPVCCQQAPGSPRLPPCPPCRKGAPSSALCLLLWCHDTTARKRGSSLLATGALCCLPGPPNYLRLPQAAFIRLGWTVCPGVQREDLNSSTRFPPEHRLGGKGLRSEQQPDPSVVLEGAPGTGSSQLSTPTPAAPSAMKMSEQGLTPRTKPPSAFSPPPPDPSLALLQAVSRAWV